MIEPHKKFGTGVEVFPLAVTRETEQPEQKARIRSHSHPEESVLIKEVPQALCNHSGAWKGLKETGHDQPGIA
jgi:hypothetical protein